MDEVLVKDGRPSATLIPKGKWGWYASGGISRENKEGRVHSHMKETDAIFQGRTGLGQIIDYAVAHYPDRTAVVSEDRRLTYREFEEQVSRFALVLQRDGVKPGDPVAIVSRNCAEYLVAEFAILRLGAVVVKINWRFAPDELQYLLEFNHVHHAIVRYERRDWGLQVYERTRDHIKFYLLNPDESGGSPFWAQIQDAPTEKLIPRETEDDAPALRIHTSGTTGRPKCVLHTHGAMLRQLRNCLSVLAFAPGVVFQMTSQLFHIACVGAYMTLAVGGTLVLMSRFEPEEYLDSFDREEVDGISVIPVILKRLLERPDLNEHNLSHLKFLNYSTCPMSKALLEEAMGKLCCDFYQSYGMTEMASIVTVLRPEDHFSDGGRHLSSVGRPIPGVEVRIEGPDGLPCSPGEPGEIVVRGPGQMHGYITDDKALNDDVLKGGWYHTRDVGWLDEDGFLYVRGRRDDMIISGGENIYPMEVVNVIMQLTEDVAEAAVYGVPDEVWGEHVKASVVLLPGSRLTVDELKAYCLANMPHYKAPKEIEFLPELPKNSTGKVLLQALRSPSRT